MSAFEAPKSPGGPGSFGGSGRRFATLPTSRMTHSAKITSPGPGAYSPEEVLGFNYSGLSGVTRSWSRASFGMSGRFSQASTRSFASNARDSSVSPVETNMPPSIGTQPSSLRRSASAFSMGMAGARPMAKDRARTPGPNDTGLRDVADRRSIPFGSDRLGDDRFGDTEGRSARYVKTPPATAYTPIPVWSSSSSYTFGHRTERRARERSPGPHVAGSPPAARLATLPRVVEYSAGLKRPDSKGAATPGVNDYDGRSLCMPIFRACASAAL